jgi:tRNA(Ile)-lysidine synthase
VIATADDFDSEQLLSIIERLPPASGFWVGFSGGADSTALLHALYQVRDRLIFPLKAIHFHHGLHPDADSWLQHCRGFCEQRSIPFCHRSLNVAALAKNNYEEVARNFRYRAIAEILGPEEIYLTAHHADDQAETVFLNLMRGSGVEGLAGIPELRRLGEGWVARPLLNWKRSDLEAYLQRLSLDWKKDPSNQDDAFDRNYLRNQLFPVIEARWPGLSSRLNRSARVARITSEALAKFINSASSDLLGNPNRMPLAPLLELELAMQTLVVRQWLKLQEIPPPPEVRLLEFLDQLAAATFDSSAEICWRDWQIKHYRHDLWLQDLSTELTCLQKEWISGMSLDLESGLGRLQLHGQALKIPAGWQVDCRRAGARIRLNDLAPRRTLKHCFRASSVPPWLRSAIPVLYWEGEPVAVGDWLVADRLKKWLQSNGVTYAWHPMHPLLLDIQQTIVAEG